MTYNTYLIPQIDDLELREWLIHVDGGGNHVHQCTLILDIDILIALKLVFDKILIAR